MFPKNEKGKRFESLHDLRDYGFDILTGEACGIGIRLLVDLSPRAVSIMEELLSVKMTDDNNSWNHQGKAGWKSIMIPRNMIDDLLVYVLAREYPYVVKVDWDVPQVARAHYCEGIPDKQTLELWKDAADLVYVSLDELGHTLHHWRMYYAAGTVRNGTRNQHVMSGRID